MIHRRGFLTALTSGLVGAFVLDPERLLWVPGAKTVFLPPVKMVAPPTNTFLTIEMITTDALRVLKQNLIFAKQFHARMDPLT